MLVRAVIMPGSLLVPEALFACSKHPIHLGDAGSTSATGILVRTAMPVAISIPVGLAFGKRRRLSAIKKWLLMLLSFLLGLSLGFAHGLRIPAGTMAASS